MKWILFLILTILWRIIIFFLLKREDKIYYDNWPVKLGIEAIGIIIYLVLIIVLFLIVK